VQRYDRGMHIIVNPEPSPSATTTAVSSATVATDAAAALGGNASNATNLTAVQGQNFAIQLPSNSSIGMATTGRCPFMTPRP